MSSRRLQESDTMAVAFWALNRKLNPRLIWTHAIDVARCGSQVDIVATAAAEEGGGPLRQRNCAGTTWRRICGPRSNVRCTTSGEDQRPARWGSPFAQRRWPG
ncbi:hypothetical protein Taro_010019 [Colocasia esculenta]|uniref:Uncharacterized protein n=1 Tax=Colocasia esculenta TaxID=4460 RepID=A0A843U5V6_COLES|nr:hypothetical protein [Colocasia esculenta]